MHVNSGIAAALDPKINKRSSKYISIYIGYILANNGENVALRDAPVI